MTPETRAEQWDGFLLLPYGAARPNYPLVAAGLSVIPEGPHANVISRHYTQLSQAPTAGRPPIFCLADPAATGWRGGEATIVTELAGRVAMVSVAYEGVAEQPGSPPASLALGARTDFPAPLPLWPGGTPSNGLRIWDKLDFFPTPAVAMLQESVADVFWIDSSALYSLSLLQVEPISLDTIRALAAQLELVR